MISKMSSEDAKNILDFLEEGKHEVVQGDTYADYVEMRTEAKREKKHFIGFYKRSVNKYYCITLK